VFAPLDQARPALSALTASFCDTPAADVVASWPKVKTRQTSSGALHEVCDPRRYSRSGRNFAVTAIPTMAGFESRGKGRKDILIQFVKPAFEAGHKHLNARQFTGPAKGS
jgi:hypothetical protein